MLLLIEIALESLSRSGVTRHGTDGTAVECVIKQHSGKVDSGGPMTRTRLRILSVWEEEHGGEIKQIVFCEIAKEP
jgi:hypothetical protein